MEGRSIDSSADFFQMHASRREGGVKNGERGVKIDPGDPTEL